MPDPIDEFFECYGPSIGAIDNGLRKLVQSVSPDATETLNHGWKCVSYGHAKRFCAIAPHKASVNLQFHGGGSLEDPASLLVGTGKSMRHVKLTTPGDLEPSALAKLIREAAKRAS